MNVAAITGFSGAGGFKELGEWPKILLSAEARPSVDELAANLDRIWRP